MINKRASKLKSKEAVRAAWDGAMTIKSLAAKLGVSRPYFNTWLKREMPKLHKEIVALHYDYANRNQKPPNYQGDCVNSAGYIRVTENGKRYLQHRLMAERKVIHRKLKPGEVVHHINGDRIDNRPTNLAVLSLKENTMMNSWMVRKFFELYPKHARYIAETLLVENGITAFIKEEERGNE